MTTPDTDDDLKNLPADDAQHDDAGEDANQSHEEASDARSDEAGDIPGATDDGTAETSDPLLLAQQTADEPQDEPAAKPAKAAPAAKKPAAEPKAADAKASKPAAKADDNQAPEDQDADYKAALEDMPAEDWQKLSHKAKSTILTQRRVVRTAHAAVKQAEERAAKASKDYEEVDKFRTDHGLEPKEFMQSVSIGAAIKRGDAKLIPFLEQTLGSLRKHHGIADATPAEAAAPMFDADKLASLVEGAERYDLDAIAELKKLVNDAKAAKGAAKPAKPAAPAAQAPVVERDERTSDGWSKADLAEFDAINQALVGAGVKPEALASHLEGLLKEISGGDGAKLPKPGERVRAVMEAHAKRAQKSPAQPAKPPAKPPMSGRGGQPPRAGGRDPSQPIDPLTHAMKRG